MNPITFNDKFAAAIIKHPRKQLEPLFAGWQAAPLFDYETTWDKELSLLPHGRTLQDVEECQWPFAMFRLCLTERNVPDQDKVAGTPTQNWTSHFLARKQPDDTVDLLIWWRETGAQRGIMMHVYTIAPDDGSEHKTAASLYVPRHGGWQLSYVVPDRLLATMAGSAIASFASFLVDCSMPSTHLAEVRPCRGTHSVSWQLARTHYTLISHGHPANKLQIAAGDPLPRVPVNQADELKRQAHDRRGHWRTYKHARYRYARGSRRWVKQTWCGPKEWMDAGGKQIYKILEPVPNDEPSFMPELPAAEVQP
jgi:hypothetical protein